LNRTTDIGGTFLHQEMENEEYRN